MLIVVACQNCNALILQRMHRPDLAKHIYLALQPHHLWCEDPGAIKWQEIISIDPSYQSRPRQMVGEGIREADLEIAVMNS